VSDSGLDGRTFLSTGVTGRQLVPGTRVRLAFDEGSLSADAGCNQMGGQVRLDGDRLIADGLAGTEMGCEPDLMEQDTWLVELLQSEPEVVLDGDALTLRGTDGTVIQLMDREVADPDRPLVGTTWRLDAITKGTDSHGTASSIPAGVTSTLRITEGGQLEVAPGCNTGGADVKVGEGVLQVGPVITTLMACTGEPGRVEADVLAVIKEGEVGYSIEADRLTLTNGDNGLVYRAG